MVTGLAAYGDFEVSLRDHSPLPKAAGIVIGRVLQPDQNGAPSFPTDTPEHVVLEEAIRGLNTSDDVRIFNVSIADKYAYSGPHVGLMTETLDRLVRELGIVVTVAVGNRDLWATGDIGDVDRHVLHDYPAYAFEPDARLAEPSLAANVISVGSIARSSAPSDSRGTTRVDVHVAAQNNQLSPFSRTGAGVGSGVKPDVVAYGGNIVWNDFNRIETNNLGASALSLSSVPADALFRAGSGTSYATPRVAYLAARIWDAYPDASANLVRALIGMSSQLPAQALAQFEDDEQRLRAFGYGLPDSTGAVASTSQRVVMTHDGEMAVDSATIFPIPIPQPFARGAADRSISVALAFAPPVRRQRREYLAGSFRVDLFRGMELSEVEELVREQDANNRKPLNKGRLRVGDRLLPKSERLLDSTLQVRRWTAQNGRSLSPDDGDTYFLVLTHVRQGWAATLTEPYEFQSFGLAVALEDRSRAEIDLFSLVQQQVSVPARLRVRATR